MWGFFNHLFIVTLFNFYRVLSLSLSANTMAELMALSALAMAKDSNEVEKKTKYHHADAQKRRRTKEEDE